MLQNAFKIKALADKVDPGYGDGCPCRLRVSAGSFVLLRWGPRSRIVHIGNAVASELRASAPWATWLVVAQTDSGQALLLATGPVKTDEERREYNSD